MSIHLKLLNCLVSAKITEKYLVLSKIQLPLLLGESMILEDGLPLSTLTYADGPGYHTSYEVSGGSVVRHNLTGENYTLFDYVKPAGAPKDSSTHSGEDVAVFAKGGFPYNQF